MQENLVIVESPAKAKTIEKFLGKDFVVKSSFGHVRDLSKKDLGINIGGGFEPVYEVPTDKRKVVEELKSLAKERTVWLASDEDREGEAIAWHLAEVLNLPVDSTKRIVFHEITKNAILKAIETPRTVNMNLVKAQQARRVLDRLVGFELSPVLWRKVRPKLSAGRVQSVAVRLIVEREREIIAFNSTPYYRVVASFYVGDDATAVFKAELASRFETREAAEEFLRKCPGATFTVSKAEVKPVKRTPAPPFTTSTLQQEASRKLGFSVSQTMSIAQRLYEQGLITYMRTDSVNLSGEAIGRCRQVIEESFGAKYSSPRNYTTKSKGAQEAHEAIRPSYIDRSSIQGAENEKRLYDLIWKRTVASQMVNAELERTTINIDISTSHEHFVTTGEVVKFDGFLKLYSESVDEDSSTEESASLLPEIKCGDEVRYKNIVATERYTQAPARYHEASLVKRLEELGIGRPSTYAPTITTIINRGYIVKQNRDGSRREYVQLTLNDKGKIAEKQLSESFGKEKNRLSPTDIGMVVNDYLEAQFTPILEYNFTANVEKEFDRVADGEIDWAKMISDFYAEFHPLVDSAVETQTERGAADRVLGTDPVSGRTVKARIGRYGPMAEIEAPEGEKPRYAALKKGQLIESITLDEALELFALPRMLGELEGDELTVGIGKFGPYIRRGKSKFTSLPKGDDPYTVTLERAVEVIHDAEKQQKAASTPIKTFDEDADMLIKNGRFGAYIAYKSKNYKIPKGKTPAELTLDECREIIAKAKK